MARPEDATEQSPLLDHEHSCPDENTLQTSYANDNASQSTPDAPTLAIRERSTRELLAIMGATWVGVFLAALGTFEKKKRI